MFFVLLLTGVALGNTLKPEVNNRDYNETCNAPDVGNKCLDMCGESQLECLISCDSDVTCIRECLLQYDSCIDGKI